jgi:NAD(P)H-quinone oxidoreductase subunit 6
MIEAVIFWVFATFCIFGSLAVVLNRSIIYSALMLIVVFLSISGIFVLNNADFLAVAQTIVYAVGLTIILLFGIMFTGQKPSFEDLKVSKGRFAAYGLVALFSGILFVLCASSVVNQQNLPSLAWIQTIQSEGSTPALGALLFKKYALPFELASILLLMATVGAIVLSKKRFDLNDTGLKFALTDTKPLDSAEQAWERAKNPLASASEAGATELKVGTASESALSGQS